MRGDAHFDAPAGALTEPATLGVIGLVNVPISLPAEQLFLGGAKYEPGDLSLELPATIHLPGREELQWQLTSGETLPLFLCRAPCDQTSTWVETGIDGTLQASPSYPERLSWTGEIEDLGVYVVFLPDADWDGIRDSLDNCPALENPSQSDADGDGIGDACDRCTDTDGDGFGDPGFLTSTCPVDNCPGIYNPSQSDADGDGVGDACDPCTDTDGDGFANPGFPASTCPVDNCPDVYSLCQDDQDNDGVGDVCDTDPQFVVSNDPADLPDFTTIQAAVDAVVESGTRIRVLPGLGPYLESVMVDAGMQINFEGYDLQARDATPIVVDGGSQPAFTLLSTLGTGLPRISNFTLRGGGGVATAVGLDLHDLVFEEISGVALSILGGTHRVDDTTFDVTVVDAISVAAGAHLELRRSRIVGISGTAVAASGMVFLENVLIGDANAGVVLGSTGNATLRHVTLAGSSGAGIDNTTGGSVTVSHSIVWGNAGGDLVNVPCDGASWSLIGSEDCTEVNDNVQADPQFVGAGDWHLSPGSPALDHGPHPLTFTGEPCFDLDGNPRQLDYDGTGLAIRDIGAYEHRNDARVPGVVTHLRWTTKTRLAWDAEPAASEYHVYRDSLSSLSYTRFGECQDEFDPNRTDEQLDDFDEPTPGTGFFYLITAEDALGAEGSLGDATCTERSLFGPCP